MDIIISSPWYMGGGVFVVMLALIICDSFQLFNKKENKSKLFYVTVVGVGYTSNEFIYKSVYLFTTEKNLKAEVKKSMQGDYNKGLLNFPRYKWFIEED